MRVAREPLTVLTDEHRRELSVLLEGLRITLNVNEAYLLAASLIRGLSKLSPAAPSPSPPSGAGDPDVQRPWQRSVARPEPAAPSGAGADTADTAVVADDGAADTARDLIRGKMKEKRLLLREWGHSS